MDYRFETRNFVCKQTSLSWCRAHIWSILRASIWRLGEVNDKLWVALEIRVSMKCGFRHGSASSNPVEFHLLQVWLNKVLCFGDFGNSKRCDRGFWRCRSQRWCPAADVQICHWWHRFVDVTQEGRSLERLTSEIDKHRIHKLRVAHQSLAIPHPAHVPGTGNCCALSEQGPRKWGTLVNLKK